MVFTITSLFANHTVVPIEPFTLKAPPIPTATIAVATTTPTTTPLWLCSCMHGLATKGIFLKGNAIDQIPNSTPVVGGVVLLKYYENVGHVALIQKFTEKGMIVWETNYKPCQATTREILWSDIHIVGFIDPDKIE